MTSSDDNHGEGATRRKVLECMTWAGTGLLWTVSGGVPRSLGLVDQAMAQESKALTFLQISDSHVGFDKPANPNVKGTLEEAIGRIKALPAQPSFMIHTGDITHLSKVAEFDDGAAVLHWTSGANTSGVSSTEVFASVSDLLRVHGHEGRSVLEPIAEQDMAPENPEVTVKAA